MSLLRACSRASRVHTQRKSDPSLHVVYTVTSSLALLLALLDNNISVHQSDDELLLSICRRR